MGGTATNLLGICSEGFRGTGCSECSPGYINTGVLECSKCPIYSDSVKKVSISISIGVIIALMVIAAVLWDTKDRLPMFQSYLKIIINHF
jgi:hypothetical protein